MTHIDPGPMGYHVWEERVRPVPCSTDAIDIDVGIGHGFDKLGKGDWIGNTQIDASQHPRQ